MRVDDLHVNNSWRVCASRRLCFSACASWQSQQFMLQQFYQAKYLPQFRRRSRARAAVTGNHYQRVWCAAEHSSRHCCLFSHTKTCIVAAAEPGTHAYACMNAVRRGCKQKWISRRRRRGYSASYGGGKTTGGSAAECQWMIPDQSTKWVIRLTMGSANKKEHTRVRENTNSLYWFRINSCYRNEKPFGEGFRRFETPILKQWEIHLCCILEFQTWALIGRRTYIVQPFCSWSLKLILPK